MALEQLKAEIAMLVQQMEDEPEDIHELHARIRSKLAEIRAMGLPLPDDLVGLERRLDSEERSISRDQQPAGKTQGASRRSAKRRPSAKRAKRPAAKKAKRAAPAKKAKRSAGKKSKRPAAKKAGRSAAKKSRRTARRRR